MKLKTIALAGLSSVALASTTKADVNLVFAGAPASSSLLFAQAQALLSSNGSNAISKVSSTNTYVRTYSGSIGTNSALGTVTIQFSLLGALSGLQQVLDQTPVPVVSISGTGGTAVPAAALGNTFPETIGISSAGFATPWTTEISPFVLAYNHTLPNSLSTITNLTQRQVALLEATSGPGLSTANLGGTSHTDWLYFVGRNINSGTRVQIDSNIYFTGTPSFWITNSPPHAANPPIPDPAFGQDTTGAVIANINVISNSIGEVSPSALTSAHTLIAYEGVSYSTNTVANGSYPFWGYDNIWQLPSGTTGAPSAAQSAVLGSFYGWLTDPGFQSTNSLFVNYYLPVSYVSNLVRAQDGGPISFNNP